MVGMVSILLGEMVVDAGWPLVWLVCRSISYSVIVFVFE